MKTTNLFGGSSVATIMAGLSPAVLHDRRMFGEGDDANDQGTGGAGEGAGINPEDPAVKALLEKAVSDATKALRGKNEELIGEKKKFKEDLDKMLAAVGGEEGLKRLQEQREKHANDELGRLLNEGKYDEWFEHRTEAMRTKSTKELEARDARIAEVEADRDAAVSRLQSYRVNAAIDAACDETHVKPGYREAVRALLRDRIKLEAGDGGAEEIAVYETDGQTRAFGPKAKPMSVPELVDTLRERMDGMFEASSGGGASGAGKGGLAGRPNPWKRGADFNITEQGSITRDDPALAKRLRAEAGLS